MRAENCAIFDFRIRVTRSAVSRLFLGLATQEKTHMSFQSSLVRNKLLALGISQALFSGYAGVSINQISLYCSGVKDLSIAETEKINQAVADLASLAEALAPLPLDYRQIDQVKALLRQHKHGELDQLVRTIKKELPI